jgi:hypothetical protein
MQWPIVTPATIVKVNRTVPANWVTFLPSLLSFLGFCFHRAEGPGSRTSDFNFALLTIPDFGLFGL